jgi:hypothetical protein
MPSKETAAHLAGEIAKLEKFLSHLTPEQLASATGIHLKKKLEKYKTLAISMVGKAADPIFIYNPESGMLKAAEDQIPPVEFEFMKNMFETFYGSAPQEPPEPAPLMFQDKYEETPPGVEETKKKVKKKLEACVANSVWESDPAKLENPAPELTKELKDIIEANPLKTGHGISGPQCQTVHSELFEPPGRLAAKYYHRCWLAMAGHHDYTEKDVKVDGYGPSRVFHVVKDPLIPNTLRIAEGGNLCNLDHICLGCHGSGFGQKDPKDAISPFCSECEGAGYDRSYQIGRILNWCAGKRALDIQSVKDVNKDLLTLSAIGLGPNRSQFVKLVQKVGFHAAVLDDNPAMDMITVSLEPPKSLMKAVVSIAQLAGYISDKDFHIKASPNPTAAGAVELIKRFKCAILRASMTLEGQPKMTSLGVGAHVNARHKPISSLMNEIESDGMSIFEIRCVSDQKYIVVAAFRDIAPEIENVVKGMKAQLLALSPLDGLTKEDRLKYGVGPVTVFFECDGGGAINLKEVYQTFRNAGWTVAHISEQAVSDGKILFNVRLEPEDRERQPRVTEDKDGIHWHIGDLEFLQITPTGAVIVKNLVMGDSAKAFWQTVMQEGHMANLLQNLSASSQLIYQELVVLKRRLEGNLVVDRNGADAIAKRFGNVAENMGPG